MNGFVERAFRSSKDLARSMMSAAGLPEPYWEKALGYALLILDCMPNKSCTGFVREAYFLWYGLTFDYSLLRTWGSRAYALNHVRAKDYGERSVPGIFVGFKQDTPITYEYEIYIPTKHVFVTSGDVIFSEHIDRSEPERLLPPTLTHPNAANDLQVKDYQNLVDTIHFDNEEGVRYRVTKVYKLRGVPSVDRVLYNEANPDALGGTIDTIFLENAINYPILLGKKNPNKRIVTASAGFIAEDAPVNIFADVPPLLTQSPSGESAMTSSVSWERVAQETKRARAAYQSACELKNAVARERAANKKRRRVTSLSSAVTQTEWQVSIARTILDWAFDYIPDELWVPADENGTTSAQTFAAECPSSSGATSADPPRPPPYEYKSEPRSHGEAMGRASERDEWSASELRELEALNQLNFAVITDIPIERVLLNSMWVYKYKTDEFNIRKKYKSRLVVRGDQAVQGYDFFETFSPVTKIESIRLVFALIILHKLKPLQLDIGNAYVQSVLVEEVYLRSIPGVRLPEGKCYRLLRSLYGLPQAGRNWNTLISDFLINLKFVRLREDLCVYALFVGGKIVIILALYVDDLLLGFDTEERELWFVAIISARFTTTVIGLPTNILGLGITWTPIPGQIYFNSVKIVNTKSILILLNYFDLHLARPVKLPFNETSTLSKSQCPNGEQMKCPDVQRMQKSYRTLVGTFIWLQTTTRVDIMSVLLILSQFVANPAYQHYTAALWLLRYLKGTIDLGIQYSIDGDPHLLGFVDADHASHESRRSIYCYIFTLAGGALSWKNRF